MREVGSEGEQTSEQHAMWEEEDATCVVTSELPGAGGGRETALSRSRGKKGCQEEEVVGSVGPHPQAMWDVELKVSTRFSNKKVRGGRGGQLWGPTVPEPDCGRWEVRKWKALVRTPQLRGLAVKERPGWGNSWKGPGGQERDVSKAEKRLSSLKCWWPRARRERGGGRGRRGAPGGSRCPRGAGLEGAGAQCGVHPQGAGEGLLPRAKVEAAGVGGRRWPGLGVRAPAGVRCGGGGLLPRSGGKHEGSEKA